MPEVDLATLIIDVLDRRFPSDSIYKFRWMHGTAIYVNDICYMSIRDGERHVEFTVMGYPPNRRMVDRNVKLYPSDPKFFDQVKELTLKNLVYYESKPEDRTQTS
jgi:hypothetical protein